MRVDICEPTDVRAVAELGKILRGMGAVVIDDGGFDVLTKSTRWRIGQDTLIVFADQQSVEIEGPDELVQRIAAKMTYLA